MTNKLEDTVKRIQTQNKRVGDAVELITRYGGTDGAHHKQWLLDQTLRTLLTPRLYQEWRDAYDNNTDENGERYGEWDEGIAP